MFAPGLLVILVPLALGLFFGPTAVAGLLPGILVSGVCMATSSAKKYIEADLCEIGISFLVIFRWHNQR